MRSLLGGSGRRMAQLLFRSVSFLFSTASLVLYIALLIFYNERKTGSQAYNEGIIFKYLPIAGVACSMSWHLLSLVMHGMNMASCMPRRCHAAADIFCALQLVALGFTNFVRDVMSEWRDDAVPYDEKRIEVIAVLLLSIASITHLGFFCYECGSSPRPKSGRPEELYNPTWHGDRSSLARSAKSGKSLESRLSSRPSSRPSTMGRHSSIEVAPLEVNKAFSPSPRQLYRDEATQHTEAVPEYTPRGFVTVLRNSTNLDGIIEPPQQLQKKRSTLKKKRPGSKASSNSSSPPPSPSSSPNLRNTPSPPYYIPSPTQTPSPMPTWPIQPPPPIAPVPVPKTRPRSATTSSKASSVSAMSFNDRVGTVSRGSSISAVTADTGTSYITPPLKNPHRRTKSQPNFHFNHPAPPMEAHPAFNYGLDSKACIPQGKHEQEPLPEYNPHFSPTGYVSVFSKDDVKVFYG